MGRAITSLLGTCQKMAKFKAIVAKTRILLVVSAAALVSVVLALASMQYCRRSLPYFFQQALSQVVSSETSGGPDPFRAFPRPKWRGCSPQANLRGFFPPTATAGLQSIFLALEFLVHNCTKVFWTRSSSARRTGRRVPGGCFGSVKNFPPALAELQGEREPLGGGRSELVLLNNNGKTMLDEYTMMGEYGALCGDVESLSTRVSTDSSSRGRAPPTYRS